MDHILIGNLIALVASVLQASSGLVRNKQKIIYMHSVQKIFGVISNLVLCGITGALMNLIGFVRNVLCYKHKLGMKEKIILIILSTALSLYANEISPIAFLPMIATIIYTLLMDIKDIAKFKKLALVTTVMWFVYDVYIKSYSGAIFDFLYIITNTIAICRIKYMKINDKSKK